MREARIRDIASKVPLGLESLDAFRLERELDARDTEAGDIAIRGELDEPGHSDAVPSSVTRAPLDPSGNGPISDFQAHASFLERGRRTDDAVTAVQRAQGAARAADVADDLEEQSVLDAAFRREILGEVGGADLIRAMDAETAALDAAQRREMVADPGGVAALRAPEPDQDRLARAAQDAAPLPPGRGAFSEEELDPSRGRLDVSRTEGPGASKFELSLDEEALFASPSSEMLLPERLIELMGVMRTPGRTLSPADLDFIDRFSNEDHQRALKIWEKESSGLGVDRAIATALRNGAPLDFEDRNENLIPLMMGLATVSGVASIVDGALGVPLRTAVRHPGDFFSKDILKTYLAALDDRSTVQLRDSGPARIFPDQDLIFGISARDAVGGVLDATLSADNAAGGAGLARRGLNALDDAVVATTLRETAPEAASRGASVRSDVVGIPAGAGIRDGFQPVPRPPRAPDFAPPGPVPSIGPAEIVGQAVRSSGGEIARSAAEHAATLTTGVLDDLTRPLTASEVLIKFLPREMQPIAAAALRVVKGDFTDFTARFQERAVTEFVGLGIDAARILTTQFQRASSRLRTRTVASVDEAIAEVHGEIAKAVRESPAMVQARRQIEVEIFLQGLEDRTAARLAAQAAARQLEASTTQRVTDLLVDGLTAYDKALGFGDSLLFVLAELGSETNERLQDDFHDPTP